jgi:hypothetical protein
MTDETYNLVDRGIAEWKEDTYKSLKEISKWLHALNAQTLNDIGCWICGSMRNINAHHIAGEKHDHRTIRVCSHCHSILSMGQKVWDRRWILADQPEHIRQAFYLQGLRDILLLKARKSMDSNYEKLANRYVEDIKSLLEMEES